MEAVHYETDGPVAIVTIDRPEVRNAIDRPTADALAAAFRRFDADEALSVAVLTVACDELPDLRVGGADRRLARGGSRPRESGPCDARGSRDSSPRRDRGEGTCDPGGERGPRRQDVDIWAAAEAGLVGRGR